MNLALKSSLVVCEGKVGCLHQKLLIVICRPITTYVYHLNISAVAYLYESGFAGLSSFLSIEYMAHSRLLPGILCFKIILNEESNLAYEPYL